MLLAKICQKAWNGLKPVHLNEMAPAASAGAPPLRVDLRTGDTATKARRLLRQDPPEVLLTTPESLAVLLSQSWAGELFADLRWVLHGDAPLPRTPVMHGHVHPCLRWQGRSLAPCFLVGKHRIILPAFSAEAAGVNVLGGADWRSYRCYVPAGAGVLDFGRVGSLAARLQ
jgi:hypothetical protein